MPTLSAKQIEIASLLASGVNQIEAAKTTGVSRSTVQRYWRDSDFRAEVEKRRKQKIELHQKKADEMQEREVGQFYSDLEKYRENLIQIHKAQIGLGSNILKKMSDRFRDLPTESFTPKDLPGMFNVANNLLKDGFEGWAELIGLDEVLRRLQEDIDGSENGG